MYISLKTIFRLLGVGAVIAMIIAPAFIQPFGALPVSCISLVVGILAFMMAGMSDQVEKQQKQILQLQQMIKNHAAKPGH